ncbi:MAG TPA: type II secretion system protein [Candidatus Microsaccharimonas sp.]|nr:type II secretion system protein [Candidatus Microsaccharimonas sp.]
MRRLTHQQSGFTLVELLVVMTIILILFGLSTVALGQPQNTTSSLDTVDTLLNDLKTQQLAAMSGAVGSGSSQQAAGVYVQSNQYTLFTGSSYSAGDAYNYVFTAPNGVSFRTTFPSGTVLFNKGDGSVSGFTAGSNTITVTTSAGSKVITITRFGAITVT